ncbi:glycosyltransferase [Mucilaginibacter sp. BT774]|uniref:glycosyltransferase family 2 protein n=1 Tax=Mucilaginibacter sp. BT774 TaxID=3062276 RepID=UPI002675AA54|nr:glycosyltransferase [Mucilaginibacter sp. BT774]MDO3628874.1 glycosyltransferase [Mucilaginibacter sp. BT774]
MHTFVIPAYKESSFLEQCIHSLLAQTVKSRVIITTSTPTDYTKNIAKKYDLPYYINDKRGIANDWNFALSKVTTPLATIAHQDDIYEPEYAENVIKATNKNVLITFTGYNDWINNQRRPKSLNYFVKRALLFPFIFKKEIKSNWFKKLILKFGDPICCPAVTFNIEALTGFSFSSDFTVALDWYAWYQLANREGSFVYINKNLMNHRIHEESETTAKLSDGVRRNEELQMFRMMWGKRTASFISWVYTLGHADNKI